MRYMTMDKKWIHHYTPQSFRQVDSNLKRLRHKRTTNFFTSKIKRKKLEKNEAFFTHPSEFSVINLLNNKRRRKNDFTLKNGNSDNKFSLNC